MWEKIQDGFSRAGSVDYSKATRVKIGGTTAPTPIPPKEPELFPEKTMWVIAAILAVAIVGTILYIKFK